jgi:hypothetical protein
MRMAASPGKAAVMLDVHFITRVFAKADWRLPSTDPRHGAFMQLRPE